MIQDILVLLLVAAAAVYTVVRLRRVAGGQNKCACGSKACGPASGPCGGSVTGAGASGQTGTNGGLPLLPPSCNQGGCGCGKS